MEKLKICTELKDLPKIKVSLINDLQGDFKDLSEVNFNKLLGLIKKHGFKYPVYLWFDNEGKAWNLDGNQRHRIINKIYGDVELPFIKVSAKDSKEAKKQILALNSDFGTVTKDGLDNFTFDFTPMDFEEVKNEFTFEQWLDPEIEEATEDNFQIPDEIETDIMQGDLFEIGNHRLMCGDSTSENDVKKILQNNKIDLVYSDPPYGISVVPETSSKVGGGGKTKFGKIGGGDYVNSNTYAQIIGDETTETAKKFYQLCLNMKFKNIVLWGGNYYADFLPISRCWFVWDKEMTGNFSEAEIAWTSFEKGGIRVFKYLWNGLSREGSREIEGKKRVHPTQKPAGLAINIFQRFEYLKNIFDGFAGSGSTLIACHKTDRNSFNIEISEQYCQVILNRILTLDKTLTIKKNGIDVTNEYLTRLSKVVKK